MKKNEQDQCVMEFYLKSVAEEDYVLKTKWGHISLECF